MFTDYYFPELGGIQDSVAITSRALARRGHQVDIHAPRYSPRDYRQVGATVRERDLGDGVRVRRRPSIGFPSSTRQSRAALPSPIGWAGLTGRHRPDLIHAHSFFGIGLEAILTAGVLKIPVIGTNHTTVAGFGPHIPFSVERASAYVNWFYNRCDHVTAPSRSVFEELGPRHLRRPRHVISNPIDTEMFRPAGLAEGSRLRAELGIGGPTITYAGRLGPEKNIDVLLHALAALCERGVTADLAIAGHGSHEPMLRALAAQLGIGPRIKFLGTLSQPKLAQLLRSSDAFAIMSTSETQSMVLLQAMASGVPVVVADTRALPEFVSPASGVLVDPHDPQRLACVLGALLASPDRRREMGAAGRLAVLKYGVERVTDEWEALYHSVLLRRSAA